jgi:DNA-binding response OmpR family regulator
MQDGSERAVVALVEDLFFASGLERALRSAGWRVRITRRPTDFEAALTEDRPMLALLDLGLRSQDWIESVRRIRRNPGLQGMPIIAFGPHRDLALRDRALQAGCTEVIANSKIMSDVARIAGRYTGDS